MLLFYWTLASILAFGHGLRNNSNFPKGITRTPKPLPSSGHGRIIGGNLTTIAEYPFAASLQHEWVEFEHTFIHFCTGTIISERWLVTSAQCALLYNLAVGMARVGSDIYYEGGQRYGIEYVSLHPLFDEWNNDYDVAVVKLNDTLIFGPKVQPVQLAKPTVTIPEQTIIEIVSWGLGSIFGDYVEQITRTELSVISRELCEMVYGAGTITDRMFCAYEEGTGPCIGDNGAPALVDGVMVGFVSWTWACADTGYPGVYIRLTEVMDWITEETGVSSRAAIIPFYSSLLMTAIVLLNFSSA